MANRAVRTKSEVFVGVGRFTIDTCLNSLRVNWIDGDRRRSDSFPDTAEITSSTYRFQKKGLTDEVAKALCSTSSITIFRYQLGF